MIEEKKSIELKKGVTIVCRFEAGKEMVPCDVYKDSEFQKTVLLPKEKLKDIKDIENL